MQALVVEPVDPRGGGQFDVGQPFPWPSGRGRTMSTARSIALARTLFGLMIAAPVLPVGVWFIAEGPSCSDGGNREPGEHEVDAAAGVVGGDEDAPVSGVVVALDDELGGPAQLPGHQVDQLGCDALRSDALRTGRPPPAARRAVSVAPEAAGSVANSRPPVPDAAAKLGRNASHARSGGGEESSPLHVGRGSGARCWLTRAWRGHRKRTSGSSMC